LAAALQRLAASRGPHANAKSVRLGPAAPVWLKGAFQALLLPTINLFLKSVNYNNPRDERSQGT